MYRFACFFDRLLILVSPNNCMAKTAQTLKPWLAIKNTNVHNSCLQLVKESLIWHLTMESHLTSSQWLSCFMNWHHFNCLLLNMSWWRRIHLQWSWKTHVKMLGLVSKFVDFWSQCWNGIQKIGWHFKMCWINGFVSEEWNYKYVKIKLELVFNKLWSLIFKSKNKFHWKIINVKTSPSFCHADWYLISNQLYFIINRCRYFDIELSVFLFLIHVSNCQKNIQ